MFDPQIAGYAPPKPSAGDDFLSGIAVAFFGFLQAPFLTIGFIATMIVGILAPVGVQQSGLRLVTHLGEQLFLTALMVKLVLRLLEKDGQPVGGNYLAYVGKAYITAFIYYTVSAIGLLLLVVPGLILAARGSLALPVLLSEHRGPIDAFNESSRLTAKKFWLIMFYFAAPVILAVLINIAGPLSLPLVDPSVVDEGAFASWTWTLNHLPVAAALTFFGFLMAFVQMIAAVLQYNLYRYCKRSLTPAAASAPGSTSDPLTASPDPPAPSTDPPAPSGETR